VIIKDNFVHFGDFMVKAAVVQVNSQDDIKINLETVSRLIQQAALSGVQLALLPENFALMSSEDMKLKQAEEAGSGFIQDTVANLAAKYNMWIVAGTIPIKSHDQHKIYAASMFYDNTGAMVCRYDKIHLFDIKISEHEIYAESKLVKAGTTPKIFKTPFATIGLSVCYDLRFPELFRIYASGGVDIVTMPAAFTYNTGKVHWHVLNRARAIENQVYLLAANQYGKHPENRETYGHSMIVNPWGEIIIEQQMQDGVLIAELDLVQMHNLRQQFPVLEHKKLSIL
jgi:predicted amidohydrolase